MLLKQEHVEYSIKICQELFSNLWLKCIGASSYFIFSFFFDEGRIIALFALLFLTIFDFLTGFIGAKMSGVEITSSKVFRTSIKILLYFMMVSAGHIIGTIIGFDFKLDDILLVFLAVTEFISILENIGKMGFSVPQNLLNKLKDLKESK
jgi:toxin secretion/phage lysis holin